MAPADGWDKMDFAVLANFFQHPHYGDVAVDGDGQVGPDLAVFNQAVFDAGVHLVQLFDDVAAMIPASWPALWDTWA